jgi:hypothetical protein
MRVLFALPILFTIGAASSGPRPAAPVTVELFTSQGCSSCPPADALIEQLSSRKDLVVLTRAVTYWDRLGWRDTLGREANSNLQRAYAKRGGVGSGVYTPQTMVQGQYGGVGSDRNLVLDQINQARGQLKAAIVIKNGVIGVAGEGYPATVSMITVRPEVVVKIGSGENTGRVIRYSNVVVSEAKVGNWQGGAATFKVPASIKAPGLLQVVIVQKENAGQILAAQYL